MRKVRLQLLLLAFVIVALGAVPAQAVNRTCVLTGSAAGGSCTFVTSDDGVIHLTYMTNWNQSDFYVSGPPFGTYPIITGPVYNRELAGVPNTTYTLVALPNSTGTVIASAYRPHVDASGYTDPTGNAGIATTGCANALVAVSGTGCANGAAAASGTNTASGTVAASGIGNASGLAAASGIGCATGSYVVASTCADGEYGEVKAIGDANAKQFAVTGTGCATSPSTTDLVGLVTGYAVSGTGCANGKVLGVSGTGDASGEVALSGTGTADGSAADLSGTDVPIIVSDTADSVIVEVVEAELDVCEATDGTICPPGEAPESTNSPPSGASCWAGANWKLSKKARGKAWLMNPWAKCNIAMSYLGAYMELYWSGWWIDKVGESYGGSDHAGPAYSRSKYYYCGTSDDNDPYSCRGGWEARARWRLIAPAGYYWRSWGSGCSLISSRELVCTARATKWVS